LICYCFILKNILILIFFKLFFNKFLNKFLTDFLIFFTIDVVTILFSQIFYNCFDKIFDTLVILIIFRPILQRTYFWHKWFLKMHVFMLIWRTKIHLSVLSTRQNNLLFRLTIFNRFKKNRKWSILKDKFQNSVF